MKINWQWLLLALIPGQQTWGEVVVDGSLGGAVQSLPGPQYNITESLGKTQGQNLFHSFSQFDIHKGETANFQASPAIFNILTRVTGGTSSVIDGTIQSNSTANLWLINPAGWIMGQGATIHVNGALHITTANAIGFTGGGLFLADPNSKSSLSFADPVDYQFNQGKQATITIDSTDILLEPGKNFSVVGGDIAFQNSHIVTPGGRILLGSNSGAGLWHEDLSSLEQVKGTQGSVSISDSNAPSLTRPSLSVNEPIQSNQAGTGAAINSGEIQITAHQINFKNAGLTALALDTAKGGSIKIKGGDINLNNSSINTLADDVEDAGSVNISGHNLVLTGTGQTGSVIRADSSVGSSGKSGKVDVALTGDLTMDHVSSISSRVNGNGGGGNITLAANNINLDQQSTINVISSGAGNAGSIAISSETLGLAKLSAISSNADRGKGDAGNINIASRSIRLDESTITSRSSVLSSGKAGNINIENNNATLKDGSLVLNHSQIATSLLGKQGDGGNISANTGTLIMKGGSIQANSLAVGGNGGLVNVNAQRSLMSQGNVLIGGDVQRKFSFDSRLNVIQAAAPSGFSGAVKVSAAQLYIAGQLAKVAASFADNRPIANDPCSIARGEQTSSLVQIGNGGLPPNASDAISLPVQRFLQGAVSEQHGNVAAPMPLALYTPSHLCSKDNT